jgi:hypothetical protein
MTTKKPATWNADPSAATRVVRELPGGRKIELVRVGSLWTHPELTRGYRHLRDALRNIRTRTA